MVIVADGCAEFGPAGGGAQKENLVNDVESARAAGIAAMHLRREADHAELRRLTDLLEVLP